MLEDVLLVRLIVGLLFCVVLQRTTQKLKCKPRMHLFEDDIDDSEAGSGRWVKSVVDKVVVSLCD